VYFPSQPVRADDDHRGPSRGLSVWSSPREWTSVATAAAAIAVHIAGLEADGEPVPEQFGAPQTLTVTVAA
jgi:hypothetical protein